MSSNFTTIPSMNNPSPDKHKDHHSSESGPLMWHMNLAFHWKSKSDADTGRNLQGCQLPAPLIEFGKTDQFTITSLSGKTAG